MSTRLFIVRHGEPQATGRDPGLTPLGEDQARAAATHLQALTGAPIALVSSPLRRAQETAAALAREWRAPIEVVDAVRELPSPSDDLAERREWLRMAIRSQFADLDPLQREWRDGIIAYLRSRATDTIVFSHAVVINAVLGHIAGHDRVLEFVPAHASVTVVDAADGTLTLIERGQGAAGPVV